MLELIFRRASSAAVVVMVATVIAMETWNRVRGRHFANWRSAKQAPQVVDLQEKSLEGTSGVLDLV